ncbi:hypothetical protein L6164_031200 [Bauhinia variegata]|uniref:Uncharacterized protein n=1 Tax=Bauhinia variegata TaxID=167791 RepID=A0ACB9LEQ8_BAUVA|nr:hypothetical protein L6164_031200 [Bauhinia variegata]
MEDQEPLLQPLIPIPTNTVSSIFPAVTAAASLPQYNDDKSQENDAYNGKIVASNYSIVIRILLVLLVALISLWANYEASKTFEVTIINDSKHSPAGRRFELFYVSNDKATRILLNTSSFVEDLLYPSNLQHPKKQIDHVTLRLAGRNFNTTPAVAVTATGNRYSCGKSFTSYIIDISPTSLEEANYNHAIVSAVQQAMARVWLWDGESRAPPQLVDGMVEYITELAGFRQENFSGARAQLPECEEGHIRWEDKDPRDVAHYLHFWEAYGKGFIQRLNQALIDTWHDKMVDQALGMPVCRLYNNTHRPHLV